MFDVTALGELLIDFTPYGVSEAGNVLFERNPGGAPANVLVALSKLDRSTAFIGMVGKDEFGVFLKSVLDKNKVNTDGLIFSETVNTTLAFVHLHKDGDRTFSFYRKPGADMMLSEKNVYFEAIEKSKIFHFGSVSLTNEPSKSATLAAAKFAREKGIVVSYDPNLRPPLWENLDIARENIIMGLRYADILKVSEEELEFITGTKDLEKGTELISRNGIRVVLVTLGAEGCFYRYNRGFGSLKGNKVKSIDATGAGDGFLGAVLHRLSGKTLQDIDTMEIKELEDIISFGNAVGALVTTKKGAIPAMPDREAVQRFLEKGVY